MKDLEILRDLDFNNLVVVCIGTDSNIADSLGPFVGTLLREKTNLTVYGVLGDPVHALNVGLIYKRIKETHPDAIILGIDASIGKEVGEVYCRKGSIRPGAGLKKVLPTVGDYAIVGVTAVSQAQLRSNEIRIGFVYNMALKIVDEIIKAMREGNLC